MPITSQGSHRALKICTDLHLCKQLGLDSALDLFLHRLALWLHFLPEMRGAGAAQVGPGAGAQLQAGGGGGDPGRDGRAGASWSAWQASCSVCLGAPKLTHREKLGEQRPAALPLQSVLSPPPS